MGRVILADDDDLVAELVTDAFLSSGHAVGWLQDGRSALELIKRRPPDLVILDCNMPEMSGNAVLREMRKSATLFQVPVLMLTGRQGDVDEEILRFEGANDYLRKPFDPAQLVERGEALMKGRRRWNRPPQWCTSTNSPAEQRLLSLCLSKKTTFSNKLHLNQRPIYGGVHATANVRMWVLLAESRCRLAPNCRHC